MNTNLKFVLGLLVLSLLAYGMHHITAKGLGFETLNLETGQTMAIYGKESLKGKLGDSVVEFNPKLGARFVSSPCPNQTCVKMGWTKGISIICVPNGVVLRPRKTEFDAISR